MVTLKSAHQDWISTGQGKKTTLKKHFNVMFPPLIEVADDVKILEVIPPPPLHTILLGPVNKLADSLLNLAPQEFQE